MPKVIRQPTRITAAGAPPKRIDEFFGRVNTGEEAISIAHMRSPAGWSEPGQQPEFAEYTLVLTGCLNVATRTESWEITAGQAVLVNPGEWVQYSTPGAEGAEYIAICLPAFALETAHRDPDPHPPMGA